MAAARAMATALRDDHRHLGSRCAYHARSTGFPIAASELNALRPSTLACRGFTANSSPGSRAEQILVHQPPSDPGAGRADQRHRLRRQQRTQVMDRFMRLKSSSPLDRRRLRLRFELRNL